jgi:hypothetical protein
MTVYITLISTMPNVRLMLYFLTEAFILPVFPGVFHVSQFVHTLALESLLALCHVSNIITRSVLAGVSTLVNDKFASVQHPFY